MGGRHFKLPHLETDKPTDTKVNDEATNYMDEDPTMLTLREEGTYWEPLAIIEATIELKNWAWEGAAHPMKDFVKKIKTVKSLLRKILFLSLFVSASIIVPIEFFCDRIPIESVFVESIKFVENSLPYNMSSDSTYLLALNVFISEIGKETLNNKELKQGHVEPIKDETQPINLGTNDEPKMIQVGNNHL